MYVVRVTRQRKINDMVSKLLEWYPEHARDLPWRKRNEPYGVFVSEIMLQQTQVKTVIRYWQRWMEVLPDVESLASASADLIHKLWEGLGYYTRVRNMQKAAQIIVSKHEANFPQLLMKCWRCRESADIQLEPFAALRSTSRVRFWTVT